MSEEEYFATGAAFERPIYEAVASHLRSLGPLTEEFLTAGIFFKRARTFAELRPRDRWVNLYFTVPYRIQGERIQSRIQASAGRTYYVVRLHSPADVDAEVAQWLLDAYAESPE